MDEAARKNLRPWTTTEMCGICGLIGEARPADEIKAAIGRMKSHIERRGPDSAGSWIDADAGIGLGHQRLAVIDLSTAGHQPMASLSGRWMLTFNGEIYGHVELRSQLGTRDWRGNSDTETLVEAIDAWGPTEAAFRAEGMFAFAAWDRQERRLWLARDRFGEKPLYWVKQGRTLAFGSGLKCALACHAQVPKIDRDALALYLRLGYVPAPRCIFEDSGKVRPGTLLSIDGGGMQEHRYWSLAETVLAGAMAPFRGSADEAAAELGRHLRRAVEQRMDADVPLGAFLSGGIDSSTIVSLMQSVTSSPVRTFTAGFDVEGFDESSHAEAIATHLGTDHTTLRVTVSDVLGLVPRLPDIHDEPFGDSSILPTTLLSALTRRHITVALTGDAGDELFYGYRRYPRCARTLDRCGAAPGVARSAARVLLDAVPRGVLGPVRAARRDRLRDILAQRSSPRRYRSIIAHWVRPTDLVPGASDAPTAFDDPILASPCLPGWRTVMATDALTELPDDILAKVDRASMFHALETRIPMLAPEVYEFAVSLPFGILAADGRGKWPLRKLLSLHVPVPLFDRPKRGFTVPIAHWLRGPLRPWAEDLLHAGRRQDADLLNFDVIDRTWDEFLHRGCPWHARIWDVLMFLAWRRSC